MSNKLANIIVTETQDKLTKCDLKDIELINQAIELVRGKILTDLFSLERQENKMYDEPALKIAIRWRVDHE
jgi:hypothetical protein